MLNFPGEFQRTVETDSHALCVRVMHTYVLKGVNVKTVRGIVVSALEGVHAAGAHVHMYTHTCEYSCADGSVRKRNIILKRVYAGIL